MEALKKGIVNLDKHIENIHKYGVPVIVTLNSFITDTEEEYEFIKKHCEELGCEFALLRYGQKVEMAVSSSLTKFLAHLRIRRVSSLHYTKMSFHLKIRY